MYECPNCGAALRFDIPTQKLKCDYCNGEYDPGTYKTGKEAEEGDNFGATVFTCTQCGAELISTDNSATGFCTYCGASTVLASRMSTEKKPEKIIPFTISKDDCKKAFRKATRTALYSPREYRDPAFLDKFRGIYIPYWFYDASFNNDVTMQASKEYRRGDYLYTENYTTTTKIDGTYDGISYDASSSFDDTIADVIAPYHIAKMIPFNPSYLCGFYADTADVSKETYAEMAADAATEEAMDRVRASIAKKGLTAEVPASMAKQRMMLGTNCEEGKAAMFPVWFLTWRNKDRLAYAVINGETGKVSMDLPVDLKRYGVGTAIIAAVLFLLFNGTITMTATVTLFWSSLLAVVAGILYATEITSINNRENHIDDIGFNAKIRKKKADNAAARVARKAEKKRAGNKNAGYATWVIILWVAIALIVLPILLIFVSEFVKDMPGIMATIVLIIGGITFASTVRQENPSKDKSRIYEPTCAFAGEIIAALMCWIKPVNDWVYYIGCILCLLGVAVTCIGIIKKYNVLATRPIPTFYDRKGGNDSAKD